MQAADQVAKLGERGLGLLVGLRDDLVGLRRVGRGRAGHTQPYRQRDQPLLGAVVQVALQAAPFGVGGVDRACPGMGQLLHPELQFLRTARAQQRPGRPGVERADRGGQPRRGEQERDPARGQVHINRNVKHMHEGPGRRRRLAALQQASLGLAPRVDVHQRVYDARQPCRGGGDRGHRQGRRGQQVVAGLLPGRPGACRGRETLQAQPVRYARPRRITTPAVTRSRWRWIRVSHGSAMKTSARPRSGSGHRG